MRLLLATLLAANAAAGSLAIAGEIEAKAEHVFKKADDNQDRVLNAAEQAKAQPLALEEIKILLHHNKHPLPAVPAPKLADRNAMTATEFVQYFKSLAGRKDAANRTNKIVTQWKNGGVSSPALSGVPNEKVYYLKPDHDDEKENPPHRVEGNGPDARPPNGAGPATNPGGVAGGGSNPRGGGVGRETTVQGHVKEPAPKDPGGHKGGKDERPKNMAEKPGGKNEPPGNGKQHGGK